MQKFLKAALVHLSISFLKATLVRFPAVVKPAGLHGERGAQLRPGRAQKTGFDTCCKIAVGSLDAHLRFQAPLRSAPETVQELRSRHKAVKPIKGVPRRIFCNPVVRCVRFSFSLLREVNFIFHRR